MSTLKILSQLEIKRGFAQFRNGKQKAFGIFIYLLSLWGVVVMGGIFPMFSSTGMLELVPDSEQLELAEFLQTYDIFAAIDITAFVFFVGILLISFFQFKQTFFHAFDQSTLWSLPVPKRHLVLSKFTGSWVWDVPIVIAFSVGSLVICALTTHSAAKTVLLFFTFLALGLLAECLGYFLRTLSTGAGSKLNIPKIVKSIFGVFIFAIVMVLYYYEIAREFKDFARFLLFYGSLPAPFRLMSYTLHGHTWIGILFIVLAIAAFFLFLNYFSSRFFSIAEKLASHSDAKAVSDKDLKPRSPRRAMIRKEVQLYWDNSSVALGSFFGVLLPVILVMCLLVPSIRDGFTSFLYDQEMVPPQAALFLILLFAAGFMNVSSFSFSLEGRSAYITYTLPIKGRTIFLRKLVSSLIMVVPAYIVTFILLAAILKPDALYLPLYLIGPLAYIFFINSISLFIDFKFANYTWTSAKEIAKNSKQSFLSSLGGLIISLVIIFIGVNIMTAYPFLYAVLLSSILIAADVVIVLLIKDLHVYHI
ncbi:MAG: hypothetical protein PUG99_01550 [Firmicutes bacterium]|nr:hypothetical protein [Bacillota bacterium]